MSLNISVVDVFCGIGGLSYGLKKAGLNVVAGIDNDPTCEFAYTENNNAKFICADISDYNSDEIKKLFKEKEIKVLVGCAPCQTFSKQTNKYKNRYQDKKWTLLDSFLKHIQNINPEIVSMENVPELIKFDIFNDFVYGLEKLNYYVSYKIIDCSVYGLPQRRKRLVLLASQFSPLLLPNSDKFTKRTVRDAIGHLSPLDSGMTDSVDLLHKSARLSDVNLQRIKQSKPGGSWKDWDSNLVLRCHAKSSGKTYSSVYGRMRWDEPSPTITTQFYSYGTGRFGHPEQSRALSLREGAILQTFPENYKFHKKRDEVIIRHIARHIGNAVPVDLGKIIGKAIISHIKEVNRG